MSRYEVPVQQTRRFKLALAERLGLNPSEVIDIALDTTGPVHTRITIEAILPADEIREMFNAAGKAQTP